MESSRTLTEEKLYCSWRFNITRGTRKPFIRKIIIQSSRFPLVRKGGHYSQYRHINEGKTGSILKYGKTLSLS